MKKFFILNLLLLLLAGCSGEDFTDSSDLIKVSNFPPYTGTANVVWESALAAKYGNCSVNAASTRAEESVIISPWVENGDTIFYIAQYPEGWALYSAVGVSEIPIFTSPTGNFNFNDSDMPDALRSIIESISSQIRNEKLKGRGNKSICSPVKKEIGEIKAKLNGKQNTIDEDNLPPGHWVLFKIENYEKITGESDKLTKTVWHQGYPWNIFSKMDLNAFGEWEHCVAGCVPIAVAQYYYYTHYKEGIPSQYYSKPVLNEETHDYSFSWENGGEWDKMALTDYDSGSEYSATLIGFVGHYLQANYTLNRTGVTESQLINGLNCTADKAKYSKTAVDCPYIFNSLEKGYPVITIAQSKTLATGKPLSEIVGHAFLIDYYKTTKHVIKFIYGYERDPWQGEIGEDDPWEDDERDIYGNIINYLITRETETSYDTKEISMNWGWGKNYNAVLFNPEASEWISGGYNWDTYHRILKRSDLE